MQAIKSGLLNRFAVFRGDAGRDVAEILFDQRFQQVPLASSQ